MTEEARRMQENAKLMALLESAKQRDATQREEQSLEHLREGYTLKMVRSLSKLATEQQGLKTVAQVPEEDSLRAGR